MPRAKKPIVDPFDPTQVVNPLNQLDPVLDQKRFYYYYHRPSGRMSLRFGSDLFLVENIETIGLKTWIAKHNTPPLKYLVAGNATRIYLKGDKAILS